MSVKIPDSSRTSSETSSNAIFDRLADGYGYEVDATAGARLKYQLVLRHLRPGDRVLDVGCGNGIHMLKVAPHCREIVGVDINARMLALAREALRGDAAGNAGLREMSARAMEFHDGSFDLVYSFSTLLLIPDVESAINEISRVLRPEGVAILDITGRHNLSQRYWDAWYRGQGHAGVRSFSWRAARKTLADAALDVLEAPALGFLDQWRYLPLIRRATFLDRLVHSPADVDIDLWVSNLRPMRRLANRWYFVCRKLR